MAEMDRVPWAEKSDLFLLFMAGSVSLGNIYSFPLAVYKNGYGAFIFLYLAFVVFVGQPLFLLEALLGQFSSCGPLHVFSCFPLAKGLGISMCLLAALRAVDGALVLAQGMLYWIGSFKIPIPWMECDVSWGADPDTCFLRTGGVRICTMGISYLFRHTRRSLTGDESLQSVALELDNGTMVSIHIDEFEEEIHGCVNGTDSSSQQFYFRRIMHAESEELNMDLLWCYAVIWMIVFVAATNMRAYTRVLRLVAPSPIVVLLLLQMNTFGLTGTVSGLGQMFAMDTRWFYEPTMWHAAAAHMLYSLGLSTGSVFVYASFNQISVTLNECAPAG